MSTGATDFEALLREALTPVDPPDDLVARIELDAGQPDRARPGRARGLGALGDARSAQLGPAGRRGGGRGERRHRAGRAPRALAAIAPRKQQSANLFELAERTLQDFAEEARRILPDR